MTAIHALLDRLIDYAGLFPPASLDMQTAVRNYSAYRMSDEAWMLGRFVVPAERLGEFVTAFDEACCGEQTIPWLLSVISTGNAEENARFIEPFDEGAAFLDAMEFKAADAAQAEPQLVSVPTGMAAYVEIAAQQCGDILPVLKKFDAGAKLRTGSISPNSIPCDEEVTRFLIACAEAKVPFKATAGLHHPLRSTQRLTYDENSATALMHGFVNLFVAATIAYQGAPAKDVIDVLNEQSFSAFQWEKNKLQWGHHRLSMKQIKAAREEFAISFGSCSFTEPVNDLKALGWL